MLGGFVGTAVLATPLRQTVSGTASHCFGGTGVC